MFFFLSVSPFPFFFATSVLTLTRCSAYAVRSTESFFRFSLIFAFVFFYLISADALQTHQPKSTGFDGFLPCHRFSASRPPTNSIVKSIPLHLHVWCQMANENCILSYSRSQLSQGGLCPCINYFNQFHLAKMYFDNDDSSRTQCAKFIYGVFLGDVFRLSLGVCIGTKTIWQRPKLGGERKSCCTKNNRMHFHSAMALCNL